MYRGTTPTLTFTLPFEAATLDVLSIAFAQVVETRGKKPVVVLEKTLGDCELSGNVISLALTEADTLSLDDKQHVEIQLRAAVNGKSMASCIYRVPVERILKDGCLL